MHGPLSQSDLITFHAMLQRGAEECENAAMQAHYEHALLSLKKIIESFGPTPEYESWSIQFSPRDTAKHCTFTIDL